MKIIQNPQELQKTALELKRAGKSIALVPTMGYLHAGHLSLIDIARKEADIVIVSIFVNPTQFGPNEDLDKYPRDFERDSQLCREHDTDIIFAPPPGVMYPANHSVWVEETVLSRKLCGLSRPIHFRGVTTVVAKLFHLSLADVAVFGQKDAQQALIIRRMVRDLDFPIRIITAPLVRDEDQVALSSRNAYLSPAERERARILSQSLFAAREAIRNGTPIPQVKQTITNAISNKADKVDYVEIYDSETLEDPSPDTSEVLIALAAFFGKTRLIDNLLVSLK
ncbi:MAG: pantoate--beta-alanine ligase [Lentisphaeria bacterium]|nr:pantoate--beta-alanine ligase [Lentisphaeria bacterium]